MHVYLLQALVLEHTQTHKRSVSKTVQCDQSFLMTLKEEYTSGNFLSTTYRVLQSRVGFKFLSGNSFKKKKNGQDTMVKVAHCASVIVT